MNTKLGLLLDEIKRARGCQDEQSLARLLGVAPSTLSHYRSGNRGLSLDRMDVIASLLEVDAYDLRMYLKGDRQPAELSAG